MFIPLTFPVILWMVYFISLSLNLDLSRMGILPRDMFGILGIISGPIVHANFSHLLSNTIPLIILGWIIFFFYSKVSFKTFLLIYVLTGLLVWVFAREVYHIGASGIVYGIVSFLFFSGIFRRDNKSITIALIVTFLYGGIVWGILPGQKGISWESHLFGGIAGIITAFIFRKIEPPKKYDWEDEEDDFDVNELEVSYDPEKNKFNL
ncbi:MAG: rhomboid family intramembrane serine protease [Bacteroidetes bacterium]|nr:rhomboid family intramembrane serine protease [Bacteroidota bacterium]MCH8032359.1 rhomboid family intramembrane serine protease [Bacteroidota bacterium]